MFTISSTRWDLLIHFSPMSWWFILCCNQISMFILSMSLISFTLDLTYNWLNPWLQLQPPHLVERSFQNLTPLSSNMGQVLYQNELGNYTSIMQDYMASIKIDPNFIAAPCDSYSWFYAQCGWSIQGNDAQIPSCNAMHQWFNSGSICVDSCTLQ